MNTEQKNNNTTITLGIMGDVMIGRLVNDAIAQHGYAYPWGSMLPLLQQNDINLINLETTLTRSTQAVPKVFNYKSNPNNVGTLTAGHITVANLANNHIGDFGIEGLRDTMSTLSAAGIGHVGAGANIDAAQQPVIIERNGITLGFIGATDNEPTWAATEHNPGTNYFSFNNFAHIVQHVKNLASQVDHVVVSLHWGPNWPKEATPEMRSMAHALVDAGARIIHGHSPHMVLGIEKYNNGLILYSAGDFIDDYAIDPTQRNDLSALFNVTLNKHTIKNLTVIPTVIQNMQVNHAEGSEKELVIETLQERSKKLDTHVTKKDATFSIF